MTLQRLISENKLVLMGVSIVLIMLFHCGVCDFGNIGVDYFLILSGMGIFCSLDKCSSKNSFYKKRVKRLLPACFSVTIPYSIFLYSSSNLALFKTILMGLSLSAIYFDLHFWFVPLIVFCYILSPWLYAYVKKPTQYVIILILCLIVIGFILSVLINGYSVFFTRIPTFVLGMFLGKIIVYDNSKRVHALGLIVGAFSLLLVEILVCKQVLPWYIIFSIYSLVSVPSLLFISFLTIVASGNNLLKSVLSYLGKITLEIYLLHEIVAIPIAFSLFTSKFLISLFSIIIVIPLAVFLSHIANFIEKVVASILNKQYGANMK